jgi:phage terminase Nu1 subunit (DNA packaging protein)
MRWVTLNQLADETGLAVRTLQYIRAQEPGVLVTRQKGKALEYKQPDCAINLRNREAKKARDEVTAEELDEARERAGKIKAERERTEMHVAKLRGELAPVAAMDAAVERLATAVRNEVSGLRSRFTLSVVGLQTPAEAAAVLDEMGRQILGALADAASADAPDEPDELEEAA